MDLLRKRLPVNSGLFLSDCYNNVIEARLLAILTTNDILRNFDFLKSGFLEFNIRMPHCKQRQQMIICISIIPYAFTCTLFGKKVPKR